MAEMRWLPHGSAPDAVANAARGRGLRKQKERKRISALLFVSYTNYLLDLMQRTPNPYARVKPAVGFMLVVANSIIPALVPPALLGELVQ